MTVHSMLVLEDITLGYGPTDVVHKLSLSLGRGAIGCLLGPSGCGKTTLLRAIGGFEPLRSGRIVLDGRTVATAQAQLPARERGIGMVFQDHALFPHLDVQANVAFGLGQLQAAERKHRVADMLALVGLDGMQRRWPHELSGGQQQRVALARALAPQPALLLLDEPFSNLDTRLRVSIAREIRAILSQTGTTAMMVTHDQHEAFAMADCVGVMVQGRLQQWASVFDIYHHPATPDLARLIGEGVLLAAQGGPDAAGGHWHTAAGPVPASLPSFAQGDGRAQVLVRPEHLRLDPASPQRGTVTERVFRGSHFLYTVQLGADQVLVHGGMNQPHDVGDSVGVAVAGLVASAP